MRLLTAVLIGALASVPVFWGVLLLFGHRILRADTVLTVSVLLAVAFVLCALPCVAVLRRLRRPWQQGLVGVLGAATALVLVTIQFWETGDPIVFDFLVQWGEALPWLAAFGAGGVAAVLTDRRLVRGRARTAV